MIAQAPVITRLKDAVDLIERLGIAERVLAINLWNPVRIQVCQIADVNALPAE